MSATSFPVPGLPPAAPTALVIEPILPHLLVVLSALSSLGFDVTVADTFADAKSAMVKRHQPTLLVTDIRLREFNGLHLVLRGKSACPTLAAVVTSEIADPVLQKEAERLEATFMVMPASRDEICAAILRTVLRERVDGRPAEPIRAPFDRRVTERRSLEAPAAPRCTNERRVRERRSEPREALRLALR